MYANNYCVIEFKIICQSENRPVKRALLNIDKIALTAIGNEDGRILLNNIPIGRFYVDIIAVGFVATTVVLEVKEAENQKIRVEMICNI